MAVKKIKLGTKRIAYIKNALTTAQIRSIAESTGRSYSTARDILLGFAITKDSAKLVCKLLETAKKVNRIQAERNKTTEASFPEFKKQLKKVG